MKWYMETADGYKSEAFGIYRIVLETGNYIMFYTLDMQKRPTPRIASWPSGILMDERPAILVQNMEKVNRK